tara:strand:- start:29 stop:247 length:219 start_codon:yes stop_codon:yes gene_type:complete
MLKKLDYKWVIIGTLVLVVLALMFTVDFSTEESEESENCKQACVAAEFNANEECNDKSTNRIAGMDTACCCI